MWLSWHLFWVCVLCLPSSTQGLPKLLSKDGGVVQIVIPEGSRVEILEIDEDGYALKPPSPVVTVDVMNAALNNLKQSLLSQVFDMIGDIVAGNNGTSPLVTQTTLEASIKAATDMIDEKLDEKVSPDDVRLSGKITDVVNDMLDPASGSLLASELAGKLNDLGNCSCINQNTIPALMASIDSLEDLVVNSTSFLANVSYAEKRRLDCHKINLAYNSLTDKCFDPLDVSCPVLAGALPLGAYTYANCSNKWGAQACPVMCMDGYLGSATTFSCSSNGTWAGSIKCLRTCSVLPAKTALVQGSCTLPVTEGTNCSFSCKAGWTSTGSLATTCRSDGTFTTPAAYCYSSVSCVGRPDGLHSIQSTAGKATLSVKCSNESMIIDFNRDPNWAQYFYRATYYSSGLIYTPHHDDLQSGAMDRFVDWFQLPSTNELEYSLSDDCSTCYQPGSVFYMTGNYVGCYYYNRNCDMSLSDFVCKTCMDNYNPTPSSGTCTHRPSSPYTTYPWETAGGCGHWWNTGPSLGANGKFCVCYRPAL